MKTTTELDPPAAPTAGPAVRPRRRLLRWALAGFVAGVASSSAYLLLGGDYFLFVPRWAYIVFYPGFVAGIAAFDLGLRQEAPKVVGVMVVGFSYGTLFALVRFAWFAVTRRSQPAEAGRLSP